MEGVEAVTVVLSSAALAAASGSVAAAVVDINFAVTGFDDGIADDDVACVDVAECATAKREDSGLSGDTPPTRASIPENAFI